MPKILVLLSFFLLSFLLVVQYCLCLVAENAAGKMARSSLVNSLIHPLPAEDIDDVRYTSLWE